MRLFYYLRFAVVTDSMYQTRITSFVDVLRSMRSSSLLLLG